MKFRRKSESSEAADTTETAEVDEVEAAGPVVGPYDVDDLAADDEIVRIDLGSLLVEPVEGLELRLQVEDATQTVQSVMLAGPEGAVELRAFAAPRNGDLWSEVRPQIAAEYAQRGGTASAQEGRWGTELVCNLTVRTDDGRTGNQASRVVGINGARWMLRATFLGSPAVDAEAAQLWESAVAKLVVRRGKEAMPVGAELPLVLPAADNLVVHEH
ncbi:DUF3710 domain-containing protein [Nocardioides sp. CN2-186]|uniref:DUF3710 domain-containing protein n=1 Tax=Nocardioides tweenelious TaxID=3156607 RepID=UPI0032B42FE2